jgi:carboxymethylenebutenolidase
MEPEILLPRERGAAGVLVIHSWWGRTQPFVEFGAALAREGFAVAVPDLFDGRTASTEAEARALRKAPRRAPMYRRLEADLAALRDAIGFDRPRIGVVGFSMGGHWAVWLSQRPKYDVSATVLYYAARGGDFSACRSSFLAHFADDDPWVSPSARRTMAAAIRKSGCAYRAFDYPGTGHWFAESDRPAAFRAGPASSAFERTARHLSQTIA